MSMDFGRFSALTFDCYGTLIDWESGILNAMVPFLEARGIQVDPNQLLSLYARLEPAAEAGPFKIYKEVLRLCMDGFADHFGLVLHGEDRELLVRSIAQWQPFPDTVAALAILKQHYRLCIVSNIDEDLILHSQRRLQVPFDAVVTAEQVGAYKPSLLNLQAAMKRLDLPKERILHVAQSLYHDIAPARMLGIANVWVNRRRGKAGSGATPLSNAVPDLEVGSLAELAGLVGQG